MKVFQIKFCKKILNVLKLFMWMQILFHWKDPVEVLDHDKNGYDIESQLYLTESVPLTSNSVKYKMFVTRYQD